METTATKSNFEYFLDGYNEANITFHSAELVTHLEQIDSHLCEFRRVIEKSEISELARKDLYNALIVFSNKQRTLPRSMHDVDFYDYSIRFSELMKRMQLYGVEMYSHLDCTITTHLLKRVVYNFLMIAKILEDARIIKIAEEVGNEMSQFIFQK